MARLQGPHEGHYARSPLHPDSQRSGHVDGLPVNPGAGEDSSASSLPRHYPNPGYLGMSSHSTIFNQVFSSTTPHGVAAQQDVQPSAPPISPALNDSIQDLTILEKGLFALNRLDQLEIPKLACLVQSWLERGVNLPLAGLFVPQCLTAVANWSNLPKPPWNSEDYRIDTRHRFRVLLENTRKVIAIRQDSTFELFLGQTLGENLRLEALGIFLTAAARATLDTCYFPPLFSADRQRRELIKDISLIGDWCLETCLALDCLNDLQLVLQYENFILHSQVDGDQSYHSWRRMGDVASSLFALGYHERIDEGVHNIPTFLAELRRACFARIYAADKSLAIFLGRPPRIVKDYCFLQLPAYPGITTDEYAASSDNVTQSIRSETHWGISNGNNDFPQPINYTADTRCSALFASLKEEVLLMFRKRHLNEIERISELRSRVVKQWQELPTHFRLPSSLKDCDGSQFERDFLAGTRLDYLHILLLLGLVSQKRASELDESLLEVAGEMLSITVEVIILRDRLVNSGTSLIWKVAQYGLPAAGIVSLALLHPISADCRPFPRSKMLQDLSTLVAEISIGAWIQAGEPNFALFTRATQTIRSLLDSLTAWKPHTELCNSHQNENTDLTEDWNAFIDSQPWEFEMDFWANLAEHPTLIG
ncbi:hypothetical protein N7463_008515 [Penicillium fimorum]|uniref:Transcription factor domain-containing protein n=1 Tax=Penicillium fimorum TaxID=1882269 RepID=A0A9W9XP40_9EURO|nr:hypothetical protein N7463_008515 [Penicillium fimorum]